MFGPIYVCCWLGSWLCRVLDYGLLEIVPFKSELGRLPALKHFKIHLPISSRYNTVPCFHFWISVALLLFNAASEWLRFNVYNGGADENLFSPADLDPRIPGYVGHALSRKTREDALTSGLRGDGRGIAILVASTCPATSFLQNGSEIPD